MIFVYRFYIVLYDFEQTLYRLFLACDSERVPLAFHSGSLSTMHPSGILTTLFGYTPSSNCTSTDQLVVHRSAQTGNSDDGRLFQHLSADNQQGVSSS